MPNFWQFPTGSMGLGPLLAIYNARFLKYLEHRGLAKTAGRKVWAFVGDGEMDEPESLAGLSIAAREGLDNLIVVVNCNLQRLDGPVRGNGSIIQELEGLFAGAGWNVIKLLWGSDWDPLFARDTHMLLLRAFHETVDGEFQTLSATDGRFNREHFFNKYPELAQLTAHLSDEDIDRLRRGGHDPVKIHAAYHAAAQHRGQPTVILAKTKKGYGMGSAQGRMTTHQQKKFDTAALLEFRDRFALPLSDGQVENVEFLRPPADSAEMKYLHGARSKLGGYLPSRDATREPLAPPAVDAFARFALQAAGKEMSTTMAFVRMLSATAEGPGARAARRAHHRRRGAHVRHGRPVPADRHLLAARPAVPAGGQHADQLLQGGDRRPDPRGRHQRGRRDRVVGRGGHELLDQRPADAALLHLLFDVRLPARRRPAVGGGRLAHARLPARRDGRPHHACRRRTAAPGRHEPPRRQHDPELPRLRPVLRLRTRVHRRGRHAPHAEGAAGRVLLRHGDERELCRSRRRRRARAKACCAACTACARSTTRKSACSVRAPSCARPWRRRNCSNSEHGIAADVYSVTSFTELRREAMESRARARASGSKTDSAWVEQQLPGNGTPIVAASDYVRAVPDLIRPYVADRYVALGTDGFGRSDTRAALRAFFEVDRHAIVGAALHALGRAAPASPNPTPPWQR